MVSHTRKALFFQSTNLPVDHILYLQRTIGNQAVQRMMKSGVIQAKLKIGQPNDKQRKKKKNSFNLNRLPNRLLLVQRQTEEEVEEIQTNVGSVQRRTR